MIHRDFIEDEIHQVHNKEYATRSSRESATYAAADIGKIVRQTDEDSYWLVKSSSPTFLRLDIGESLLTSTTDATTTVVWTYTLADNSSLTVDADLNGMETDGSNRALYGIKGLFYRDGGSATQQGATITKFTAIKSDGTWGGIEFSVSGNDVRVRITGLAATNISWIPRVVIDYVV